MKINNYILTLLLVLIAVLSISAVSAENVSVDNGTVIEASSDVDDILSATHDIPADATVSDIENIIANTTAGDTLNFAENTTYDFGNISSGVKIEHTLILEGNGATIKGYNGFVFEADEESVAGSQVYNLNFIMIQENLYNGRALEFQQGGDYIIEGCTFTNGNSGIYIRRSSGNVTIQNNEFIGEEGATDHSSIGSKKETGMKAINIMGGTGITISNNNFEGDMLDAVSIASGAANVEMYENMIDGVWYGVFYGGGITNITVQSNLFTGNKVYALGIVKAAGTSNISENKFYSPDNATAIYVEEGNTAHGAPSNIETILIHDNVFKGDDATAVAASSKGGMITPKGEFIVAENAYEEGVTVFAFTDNNTYTFKTSNLIVEENRVYIGDNILIKNDPEAEINITSESVDVTLAEDATGYLLIDVDNVGYYVPIENGKTTFDIPALGPGNYTVTATYTGDNKYSDETETKNITIEGPAHTVVAENLTKIEKAPDRFEANFTDANGNALANTDVTFELNGQKYTRTTDAKGIAGININLVPGTYEIVSTNPVTKESITNTITVLSRLEGSDLTKYFRNASQYRVKVLDDNGNLAKAGEIVTFNINGVFYNRTVSSDGYAQLSINLNPGDYVITTQYKGCEIANNVKVLPILTAKDLTKKYGESGEFEATLVDGQGNPSAGQNITFNINGVLYTRTTNVNGVAQLNINLMPGSYIITSSYGEATTSNTVTVTN
ncbi:right-handed parallel beta-helix repeat-containing protein [Methanobrevibacter sp.]|uniref:right-handed parallel beta-helix repeat-containing protein n=1 Tax=Methanobrevibacter sp. TaxID=66852 RepID=UPI00388FC42C